ncbi:N-acylglucosamine 2-epimerase [Passer montanus]|uniref:N-acylglucosamine 2-epimerase n=1 Tax=Passer montanus TaxID=9160 RepID=UPI0019610283|nr:N-acylglucosamine 2-epimerase [Passer montanus]
MQVRWLQAGEFLESHVRPEPGSSRAAFALSRAGLPVRLQRSFYSEAFAALGLHELGRAAGDERYLAWGRRWAEAVWGWARGAPLEGGRPQLAGTPPQQALAQALMVLTVGLQLWGDPPRDPQSRPEPLAEAMAEWGARHVLMHLQRGDSVVLENVTPEGGELPGSLGRLMNPAGLEWSMKLWWPHAEAMVALLAALRFQPRPGLLSQFLKVAQYTFDKFRDPEHGEWFGYLNRDGSVALSIKGGPYKGCFHVPRALLMCEEMLDAILEGEEPPQ